MMARMLSQLPLPLLPSGAAEIAPGVGFLAGEDGGLVTVHGLATFAWDAGDEAGRRLAAVQLVRLRAASQGQVADAFGGGSGHDLAVGSGAGRGRGGRAGPGTAGPEGGLEADAGAGGADRRAGRGRGDAAGDRRRDRGIDVHCSQRAGPGPV